MTGELVEFAIPLGRWRHQRRMKRRQGVDPKREELLDEERGVPRIDRRSVTASRDEGAIRREEGAHHQHQHRGEQCGEQTDAGT
jgi:hypothetical protein